MNYITLPYCVNHFTSYDNINPQSVRGEAFYSLSRWRDLNPRPLPYQGSALPLSYIGNIRLFLERKTGLKPAALSLEGWCSINWATSAKQVGRDGFEPPKRWRSRFTVCPIWPLWNLPIVLCYLSLLSDSNQRPRDYKSRALANWAKEASIVVQWDTGRSLLRMQRYCLFPNWQTFSHFFFKKLFNRPSTAPLNRYLTTT